ncbi:MAG: thioredoxin domain-containing protein [Ferruginibacter sp.]
MATASFSNRLLYETSPYLLQHAHNPVDWYPWGPEALQRAREENKVILVSIGYSACHWCHVMERESFEDEAVAAVMNAHFINIKIDREERPDLDHIYMDAVQAMTGSGGWPLNVFLTPDAKPFYGGTYFPPVRAHGRQSWKEVLFAIKQAWLERNHEIQDQAEQLTRHLQQTLLPKAGPGAAAGALFGPEQAHQAFATIMRSADKELGGFGHAPKFPQFFTIQWLLHYYYFTGETTAREQALLSLDKMLEGGIYDQVGGGLARYSTDNEWLVPHFEKMLYDNAHLLLVLSEAFQLTQSLRYENAIRQTIGFLQRECYHPEEGFCAALDADSEGVEGKYYVWSLEEINSLLGGDAADFAACFGVTQEGNWEGKNILHQPVPLALMAQQLGQDPVALAARRDSCLERLLAARNLRVRPGLDDKKLLGWNALLITGLCRAAAALSDKRYLELAISTFNIILKNFRAAENECFMQHSFKAGKARFPAFLDDYAALIQAAIGLFECSSQKIFLEQALAFCNHVLDHFRDPVNGYFFFTAREQDDCIVRKKEMYDGATASGNSLLLQQLHYLAVITDNAEWKRISADMMKGVQDLALKYPTSFSLWGQCLLNQAWGMQELVITGNNFEHLRDGLLRRYMPNRVLQCSAAADVFPLLSGKIFGEEPLVYRCENYTCAAPVKTLEEVPILRSR